MASIIKANQLQDFGGNSIITSDGSGTITLSSGMNTAVAAGTNSTPAFFASNSGTNQDISDDTGTKVNLGNETFDTDNAFANSKFTVPSGEGGKYFFTFSVDCNSQGNSNMDYSYLYIYKNGSIASEQAADFRDNPPRRITVRGSIILDLSAGDYIELYININDNSGSPRIVGDSGLTTYLGGHKLIGV